MSEANRIPATAQLVKLAIAALLGVGIGIYVGKGMSHEPASPVADPGAAPAAGGAGYLPSQVTNKAKEIEPLPPTF